MGREGKGREGKGREGEESKGRRKEGEEVGIQHSHQLHTKYFRKEKGGRRVGGREEVGGIIGRGRRDTKQNKGENQRRNNKINR